MEHKKNLTDKVAEMCLCIIVEGLGDFIAVTT